MDGWIHNHNNHKDLVNNSYFFKILVLSTTHLEFLIFEYKKKQNENKYQTLT